MILISCMYLMLYNVDLIQGNRYTIKKSLFSNNVQFQNYSINMHYFIRAMDPF